MAEVVVNANEVIGAEQMDDYVFIIRTSQASAFRTLVEALKENLTEVNIEIDQTGMKIMAMDSARVALIHMKLLAKNFETFYCPKPVVCGVSMVCLFKLLKTMSPDDSLSFYIEKDEESVLKILVETTSKNLKHTFQLKLMDVDVEKLEVPATEFESVIRFPSIDFQKLIRDMKQVDDEIEIKSTGNQLIFSVKADWVKQETVISEVPNGNGLSFIQNLAPEEVIEGVFSLEYLFGFTKCTNLCPNIEIYLKNDYPIIIKYSVANLGEVKFCLAPKNKN